MANIYDCALVYTPQLWVEKFHRHCTNTGQLKIRSFIYDSTVLFSDEYDVAIISDTWPALSRALVERIKSRGARVIGMCEAVEASREFLSSIGVDGIIDSSLDSKRICEDIITLLDSLSKQAPNENNETNVDLQILNESLNIQEDDGYFGAYSNVSSVIGTGGSGSSEIAIVLATRLIDSMLIDVDFEHPSLAPRTNLEIEPHIIDAIETAQNNKENFLDVVKRTGKFSAIVGLTHASLASDIRDYEISALLEESKKHFSNVILDCGNISPYSSFFYLYETLLQETNSYVIVGDCTPNGIIRILEALVVVADFINSNDNNSQAPQIEIIINRAPKDKQLAEQICKEIEFCAMPCNVSFIHENKEIQEMSWRGELNHASKWLSSFDDIAARIVQSTKDRKSRNRNLEQNDHEAKIDERVGESI